jgi:hypothetical protein
MPRTNKSAKKTNGADDQLNDPEAVAKRAYEIYLRRGGNDGADLDDWLEAERELRRGPTDVTGPVRAKARKRKTPENTGL